jgi:hypothetical protein
MGIKPLFLAEISAWLNNQPERPSSCGAKKYPQRYKRLTHGLHRIETHKGAPTAKYKDTLMCLRRDDTMAFCIYEDTIPHFDAKY